MKEEMLEATLTADELLKMEPQDVLMYLKNQMQVYIPPSIKTSADKAAASKMLVHTANWSCFLREMEQRARLEKRIMRIEKRDRLEIERMLGLEEVFEMYKKNCEQVYDTILKQMTLARLQIDEAKFLGAVT